MELIELWWYSAEYLFLLFSDSDVIPLKGQCTSIYALEALTIVC